MRAYLVIVTQGSTGGTHRVETRTVLTHAHSADEAIAQVKDLIGYMYYVPLFVLSEWEAP